MSSGTPWPVRLPLILVCVGRRSVLPSTTVSTCRLSSMTMVPLMPLAVANMSLSPDGAANMASSLAASAVGRVSNRLYWVRSLAPGASIQGMLPFRAKVWPAQVAVRFMNQLLDW